MYGSLDVSTSGMIAQRTRMEVIASNIANAGSIENDRGEYEPYLRRAAMFSPVSSGKGAGMGVEVAEIQILEGSTRPEYRPEHPFADEGGYIQVPDIDPTIEWVNGLQASRAYEANIVAAETTKNMMAQALRLLA
ncbi:MAG: flagellar basal body rod protein FlgC [Phycisphaerales bacterium]|jgi:flagellar basal-body rod protein FlgC|nr:flagellar basal body rod protein FlgC [Phycisphaerales bacterium]|tara:strand:- start:2166 stop:2570 length:405 start_codon:yes stop_codon:yes gene_type:complete